MWTLVKPDSLPEPEDTKSWHIGLGTTQRCNKLTRATSRRGLYNSGVPVFTTLEVYNPGVFTATPGFYADTRF